MENNHDLNAAFESELLSLIDRYMGVADDLKPFNQIVFLGVANFAIMLKNVSKEEVAEIAEMLMNEDRKSELSEKINEIYVRTANELASSN